MSDRWLRHKEAIKFGKLKKNINGKQRILMSFIFTELIGVLLFVHRRRLNGNFWLTDEFRVLLNCRVLVISNG